MTVALITSNQRMAQTLKEAFGSVDVNLALYVSVDEYNNAPPTEVCLVDLSEESNQKIEKPSEKASYFGIIEGDMSNSDEKNSLFFAVYTKPLRIGALIQDIQLYFAKKQQLSALSPIKMGKFTLNPRESSLVGKNKGENYKLTEKEQDILLYLYNHQSDGVTKQGLLDGVWGYADGVETHTLETHIYRLRQKIEPDPANPEFLVTDGQGYSLNF